MATLNVVHTIYNNGLATLAVVRYTFFRYSLCCSIREVVFLQFTAHINNQFWRPEGPSRHDVSFGVIKPVDDHLVRLDGRVRFGNGRLGHLEGLVGGEGLGVDGVD